MLWRHEGRARVARVAVHEPQAYHPTLEAPNPFTESEASRAYAAQRRRDFIARIGARGREATTYDEQYEIARLDAEAIVANPRFHMTYQHRESEKNIAMVQAMLYWRDYKDILPPEEVEKRAERYLDSLPLLGRLRMRRSIWQRSHRHRVSNTEARCA
jgi:hypothetical protein